MSEFTYRVANEEDIVGFSAFYPEKEELRAVYVALEVARKGVGSKLLELVEDKAREMKVSKLEMHSTITAKPFYERHGYENLGEGIHTLSSGVKMKCFFMKKSFD